MRRTLLALSIAFAATGANAQVQDTVQTKTSYTHQVYYSLANDEQKTVAIASWDLAFNLKDIESSVRANTTAGVQLWGYPKGDKTAWASVDTTGMGNWEERVNNDVSWSFGAMGDYIDPSNQWDVDWGIYDPATHDIFGDSLYIIKTRDGNYKKLLVESLIKGVFTIKYADLDGSNELTKTITKANYTDKNFAYFDFSTDAAIDLEPASASWDLLFTRYTAMIDMGGSIYPYNVSGVLHNRKVTVAEVENVADVTTFNNFYPEPFHKEINTIGYNWKEFDLQTNNYEVKDSLVYFIKSTPGDIWKVIFTGFFSTGGETHFIKQKLVNASVNDTKGNSISQMALSPNPAATMPVTLVYNFDNNQAKAAVNVYDMAGRLVHTNNLDKKSGMHHYSIPAQDFASGIYMVTVDTDNGRMSQRLVVQ
jgi:hypothetical protein